MGYGFNHPFTANP